MSLENLKPLKELDAVEQAVYFHARERRRSLAGVPELFRTHHIFNDARVLTASDATNATPIVITTTAAHGLVDRMTVSITGVVGNTAANTEATVTVLTATTFELDGTVGNGAYVSGGDVAVFAGMAVPLIDTDSIFPLRSGLVTFKTAIRVTGASPIGLCFEFGGSTRGCGLGILNQFIAFTAGGLTTQVATALFNNGADLPIGLELDLVCAVSPGDGRVRIWANGNEIARDTASSGSFGGDWADTDDGSFASVAAGTAPAALAAGNVAPTNFEVIEPLSVYIGSKPRHFV